MIFYSVSIVIPLKLVAKKLYSRDHRVLCRDMHIVVISEILDYLPIGKQKKNHSDDDGIP